MGDLMLKSSNTFTSGQRHSDSDPALFSRLTVLDLADIAQSPDDMTWVSLNTPAGTRPLKSQCRWFTPSNCPVKTKSEMVAHDEYCLLIADLDECSETPEGIAEQLIEVGVFSYVIYDTVSSRPSKRRLRVVIPLSEPVGVPVWTELQHALTFLLDADDCTTRAQQISYLPTLSQFNQDCYEAVVNLGALLDPLQSEFAQLAKKQAYEASLLQLPEVTEELRMRVAPSPSPIEHTSPRRIDPFRLFNEIVTWDYLLRCCGFTRAPGGRWLAPCSSSGVPGVTISTRYRPEGGYLSSHSSDPLCYQNSPKGKMLHDKFDVWMVHHRGLDPNTPSHRSQAIKLFAESYVLDTGITLQRHNQRAYMAQK